MKDICQIIRKPLLYVIINIIISKSETFLFTNLHKKYMLCYTVFCVFFVYRHFRAFQRKFNGNRT